MNMASISLIIIKDTVGASFYYAHSMENPTMGISVIFQPDKIYGD
jgi:hypothetical protein